MKSLVEAHLHYNQIISSSISALFSRPLAPQLRRSTPQSPYPTLAFTLDRAKYTLLHIPGTRKLFTIHHNQSSLYREPESTSTIGKTAGNGRFVHYNELITLGEFTITRVHYYVCQLVLCNQLRITLLNLHRPSLHKTA